MRINFTRPTIDSSGCDSVVLDSNLLVCEVLDFDVVDSSDEVDSRAWLGLESSKCA